MFSGPTISGKDSAMFCTGDEGLTPKLLSAFVRIVEREVRESIPVRDDGNFEGWAVLYRG